MWNCEWLPLPLSLPPPPPSTPNQSVYRFELVIAVMQFVHRLPFQTCWKQCDFDEPTTTNERIKKKNNIQRPQINGHERHLSADYFWRLVIWTYIRLLLIVRLSVFGAVIYRKVCDSVWGTRTVSQSVTKCLFRWNLVGKRWCNSFHFQLTWNLKKKWIRSVSICNFKSTFWPVCLVSFPSYWYSFWLAFVANSQKSSDNSINSTWISSDKMRNY